MKRRTFLKSIVAAIALSMVGFASEVPPKIEEPEWIKALWSEIARSFTLWDDGNEFRMEFFA